MRSENFFAAICRLATPVSLLSLKNSRQALPVLALLILLVFPVQGRGADPTGRSAGFQADCIAIKNARIVTAPGSVIESGTIVIRKGVIEAVGPDAPIPADARVIDGRESTVYAGFIDAARDDLWNRDQPPQLAKSRTPNQDRFAFAAMPEDNRRGLTPEYQVARHLNAGTASEALRKSGYAVAHAIRSEPIVGGEGALITLSGAPPREILLTGKRFLTIDMTPPPRAQGEASQYPSVGLGVFAHLRQTLLDAQRYRTHHALAARQVPDVPRPARDDVLDALVELLEGKTVPLFRAESADRIDRALDFSGEFGLKPVLWGGHAVVDRLDRIKEAGSPVVIDLDFGESPEQQLKKNKPAKPAKGKLSDEVPVPTRVRENEQAEWVKRVSGAARLTETGVLFAFSSRNLKDGELFPRIREMISHGLSHDAALAGLTTQPAQLLGLPEGTGTLKPGAPGHLVVLSKPLDQENIKVRFVISDGYLFEYAGEEPKKEESAKPDKPDDELADTTPLQGDWGLRIEANPKSTIEGGFTLKSSGKRFEGTFTSSNGSGRLLGGTQTGSTVKFRVEIGAGQDQIELKFEGKLSGEGEALTLQGSMSSPFGGPAQWSAARKPSPAKSDKPASQPETSVALSLDDGNGQADGDQSAPEKSVTKELPSELLSDRHRPVAATPGFLFLKGATVLPITGKPLQGTSISVKNGKIAAIGADLVPEEGQTVIDLTGHYIMPGMIDTHSHIMLRGNLSGINEASESITCEVRVSDVLQSDDPSEYRAVTGGLTTARLLHGSANSIGGQHAIVKLKVGASAREHLMPDAPPGVKFALGENVKARSGRFPNTRLGVEATIKRAFYEGLDYRRQWMEYNAARAASGNDGADLLPPRRDLRLETLSAIVSGENFIHSHCYRADEILMLLRATEEVGIRVRSLQHVLEGYKIAPEIGAHGASCSTFSDWWAYKIEAFDATPYNTTVLNKAGINTVLKSDDAELMRHMNLEAAKSMRYGNMRMDEALKMVTINPAKELGIADRVGSIEVGKDADLAVFNGHPFNSFSRCELTIIDGDIIFQRSARPTVMTEKMAARKPQSGVPLARRSVRNRTLALPEGQSGKYAIVGATIYPVTAEPIRDGIVLIDGDRITAIGRDIDIPKGFTVIDADGLSVYPGLIDAGTTLGLSEVRKVVETVDVYEIGRMQPDLRAGISVNAESELIPVNRAGGITLALAQPQGGLISGQSSLVQTAGWTAEKMVRDYRSALHVNWPDDKKAQDELTAFFNEARQYASARDRDEAEQKEGKTPARPIVMDPRYESMRPYLRKERPVHFEANQYKRIVQVLNFAQEQDLKIVITGATDAWKLADLLAERKVPCIIGATMQSPLESWDPFDATYANAGRLHEAGVEFCFRSDQSTNSRNLAFEASITVAYGLPEQEALKAVTINAARILGCGEETGSVSTGKLADLLITDGNPLQHTTQIKGVFVGGVPHPPTSKQTRLFEKYMKRLD